MDHNYAGDLAAVEDRENPGAFLYATAYDANNQTLSLYGYNFDNTNEENLLNVANVSGVADLQIGHSAGKLLINYYTGEQNIHTLCYPSALAVYNLDDNFLTEPESVINFTSNLGEVPARGSAVFSTSGNTVYLKYENEQFSGIYSLDLSDGMTAPMSYISGNLLAGHDENTYLEAKGEINLYFWTESSPPSGNVQAHTLSEVLPNQSIKTGKAPAPKLLIATRHRGQKYYELKDHLGNVRATISDLRTMQNNLAQATLESYNNYYPFGMLLP